MFFCDPSLLFLESDHYITQREIIRKYKLFCYSIIVKTSFNASKTVLLRTSYACKSFKVFNYIIHFFFLFVFMQSDTLVFNSLTEKGK
ncbi:hypothetical protein EFS38_08480 [Dickeya undicola]|uniref:Uncharacterized protein n=1 Tax=Dickeya undicola TaxID=1577887 RepID=A0ABX9WVV0_9GAMM|nr:hypothetical protein EFS38_08480 [Dickeya undicola]